MPWSNDRESRRRSDATYSTPEYRRARDAARRRADGRCEGCDHRHARLQCDHIIPRSQGGGHASENLRMLCAGEGSCKCHEHKTAQEGGGFRSNPGSRGGGTPARDPEHTPRTQW